MMAHLTPTSPKLLGLAAFGLLESFAQFIVWLSLSWRIIDFPYSAILLTYVFRAVSAYFAICLVLSLEKRRLSALP